MSGIVERLRARGHDTEEDARISGAAADEIDRLTARVKELEEALKPFAEAAHRYDPEEGDDLMDAWDWSATLGQLRKARAALTPAPEKEPTNG